jgi:CRISPR-associated exonuclease Cas4
MFLESDLLPISALQHLAFCERQWALIHLEGSWSENRLTAEGRSMHERSDEPKTEVRGDLRVARGLRLRSLDLGLVGIADVVEFHKLGESDKGLRMEGIDGYWQPYPVEYKHGSPKPEDWDKIQLCAQAMCLEEMLGVQIPEGALFYGRPRRREEVKLDEKLRQETIGLVRRLHELNAKGETPAAIYEKRCESCSLMNQCLPKLTGDRKGIVVNYIERSLKESSGVPGDPK